MTTRSDYPLPSQADHGLVVVEHESGFALFDDELRQRVRVVGRFLRAHGIARGDRVVVVARGGADTVVVVLALLARGIVAVPTNPGYQDRELAHVFDDSGSRFVIETVRAGDERSAAVARVIDVHGITWMTSAALIAAAAAADGNDDDDDDSDDVDDEALAMLIYTSGTTGRSKGCAHTVGDLRAGIEALMALWEVGPDDVVINALPLFHVHGLCVALLGALWRGARTRLVDQFSPPAIVDAVEAGGTVLMTVPTMIHRLLAHCADHVEDAAVIGKLRLVTCGSAALAASQLEAFRAATGLTILERYGMSETLITVSNPLHGERIAGAVGRAVPGTKLRVVDDELQVQTPGMMRGYWRRPDADAEAFVVTDGGRWFRTGDAVTIDDDGVVRIVGRLSQDILKVGGYKLSTREIEEAVASHDDVVEVAVVGLPDAEWGERVCAVVVLKAGRTLELNALQQHVQLAEAKKPRALIVVDALPRNALGKVQKHVLKDLARERLS